MLSYILSNLPLLILPFVYYLLIVLEIKLRAWSISSVDGTDRNRVRQKLKRNQKVSKGIKITIFHLGQYLDGVKCAFECGYLFEKGISLSDLSAS